MTSFAIKKSPNKYFMPLAILIAFIIWFFLFAVPGTPFWTLMAIATLFLGGSTFIVYPDTLKATKKEWIKYLFWGVVAAIILYLIFAFGNFVVRFLPFSSHQIESVYSTRSQASKTIITLLLLCPIGPGEELFWRGWVQRSFTLRFGPLKGFIFATILYTIVHIPSMNFVLIAAAFVAGSFWGWLYWKVGHIGPGIVSHALWDVAAFTILPFI